MRSWLVVQGVRSTGAAQSIVNILLWANDAPGEFSVVDAETTEAAAQKFLDDTDADACLVFPVADGEAFLRQLKAVRP